MALKSWPLFGLRITTPRLELRYVDDDLADALMQVAATDGVHDPDFMPFSIPWTRIEPPELERQGMQHYWRLRADTTPAKWALPFATIAGGDVVGVQTVGGDSFAVRRWVETGSWLGRSHQGKGIGKEMRAAVLHLAFDALGAQHAGTSAFADNGPSNGVTRSLGYRENGWVVDDREGKPARQLRYVMERADWEARRRDDITVEGVDDEVRAMLGA
jgi:RimJ/RimL family protein N-acetyltransferase